MYQSIIIPISCSELDKPISLPIMFYFFLCLLESNEYTIGSF